MGVMGPVDHAPSFHASGSYGLSDNDSTSRHVTTNLNNVGVDWFNNGNLDGALRLFNQALSVLDEHIIEFSSIENTNKKGTKRTSTVTEKRPSTCLDVCGILPEGPSPKRKKRHEANHEEATVLYKETSDSTARQKTGPQRAVPPPITPLSNIGMYCEEAEDDRGTVCFDDPVRFAAHDFLDTASLPKFPVVESASKRFDAASISYNIALVHRKKGLTGSALQYFERALSLLRPSPSSSLCTGQKDGTLSLAILNNIGCIHFQAGRSDMAMRCFLGALSDGEELHTESPSSVNSTDENSTITKHIASIFDRMFSTSIDEDLAPIGGPSEAWLLHQATTIANIGQLYFRLSKLTECMDACRAAASIRRHVLGDRPNLCVAAAEYNMGLIAHKLGNVLQARTHYESFLSMARRPANAGGVGDTPEGRAILATALNQVGLLQGALGRTDEAIETLSDVLRVRREVYGDSNAEVAKTLFSIGQLHFECDLHDKAMELFKETLRIARKVLKPHDMIFVFTYSYVGQILNAKGKIGMALSVYEEALTAARSVFGEHHYIVINILNVIGNLRLARNEYGPAWNCFARASGIVVRTMLTNNDSKGRGIVVSKCQKKVAPSA